MAAVVDGRRKMGMAYAVTRHAMKCRRGDNCPLLFCRRLQRYKHKHIKERLIQAFNTSSPLGKHYAKCREGLDGQQLGCVCDCSIVRANMRGFKDKYFNESPMTLQLLAACSVPKDQILDPHPYLEVLLRLNYSATHIQRRWRKLLHSRVEEEIRAEEEMRLLFGDE